MQLDPLRLGGGDAGQRIGLGGAVDQEVSAGRAAGYGYRIPNYLATANAETVVAVQVETAEGLGNAAEISAVDGVDVVFVGPGDLSVSLGAMGLAGAERLSAAIEAILSAALANGKTAGIFCAKPDDVGRWATKGASFFILASDTMVLGAGMAAGAHMTLIPEQPFDVEEVCRLVKQRFVRGDSHFICVVAEGAKPAEGTMQLRQGGMDEFGHEKFTGVAQQLALEVEKRIKKDVRVTVLGHVQRGGTPTAYDRVLATRFGVNAADAAHAGEYGMMVSLRGQDIGRVSLADATRQLKLVPQSRYDDAAEFFG